MMITFFKNDLIFCLFFWLTAVPVLLINSTIDTNVTTAITTIEEVLTSSVISCPSEIELRQLLTSNADYAPSVRPLLDATKPVVVTIGLSITRLNDIVEKDQLLSITSFVSLDWFNEYLVWQNDSRFSCIDNLVLQEAETWLPDVSLTNTGDIYDLLLSNGHKVLVRNDGRNFFRPAKKIDVYCELDLTYFPFDSQKCTLQFESWLYTTAYQTFKLADPPVRLVRWVENDQWMLENTGGHMERICYEKPDEFFDRVNFVLFLKRRVAYYTINVIIPSIIIAFVELVIFMLPTVEIEKVPISFTCLLAYSVFQLMINDDMPRTSEHTPLLSYYIVLQMFYLSMAIMGQGVAFLFIWNLEQIKPVPQRLYHFFRYIGRVVRVKEENDEEIGVEEHDQNLSTACENLVSRHPSIHVNGEVVNNKNEEDELRRYVRRLTQMVEREDDIMSRHRRLSSNNVIPIIETLVADSNLRLGAVAEDEETNIDSDGQQRQQTFDIIVNNTPEQQTVMTHEPLRKTASSRSKKSMAAGDRLALTREMLERIETGRQHSIIKAQWLFMANVVDRCILIVYLLGIVVTPVVIFGISPFLA